MRTLSPWAIRGMASTWGGVGAEIPVSWSSPFSGGDSSVNVSGATEFLLFAVHRIGELEDKLPRLLKVSGFRRSCLFGYFLQEVFVVMGLHKARQFLLQIFRLDYGNPSVTIGAFVHELGSIRESVVYLQNRA